MQVGRKRLASVGDRYGRWVVVEDAKYRVAPSGRKFRMVVCRCDCGTERVLYVNNLVSGKSVSCRCYMTEQTAKALTKHGQSGKAVTPEYKAWCHMRERVKEHSKNAADYYHRGIKVCDRWLESFENFYADMGDRPPDKVSIDRIDNNGHYEPGNCQWATSVDQNNNKRSNIRLTFYGTERTLAQWCQISGVLRGTVLARLAAGWPEKFAVWANTGSRLRDLIPSSQES